MKLGVIADDFTGATDIAGFLVANGVRTIQVLRVPARAEATERAEVTKRAPATARAEATVPGGGVSTLAADAYVVSLKSRSCPPEEAVAISLGALQWLREQGCTQFYFKYCSTFDSTDRGNIGPVADALLHALSAAMTVVCPALPVNGRTLYHGYLFVHDQLLHESGMRDHPVTPMRDSKIKRVLERQLPADAQAAAVPIAVGSTPAAVAPAAVAEIFVEDIERGAAPLRQRVLELRAAGVRYIVMDTLNDQHLDLIAAATEELSLVTGGSGLAAAMARRWRAAQCRPAGGGVAEAAKGAPPQAAVAPAQAVPAPQLSRTSAAAAVLPYPGRTVILSGSCSVATNRQVAHYAPHAFALPVDVPRCLADAAYLGETVTAVAAHLDDANAPLLYATSPPEVLKQMQELHGGSRVGEAIESFFGALAVRLREMGVRNFIVAGGETSGKVVQALGLEAFHIGPQIAPGVPWTTAVGTEISLALKSGNFGADDFFFKAQEGTRVKS